MNGGTDPLGVFDDPAYAALAVSSAEIYAKAEPFPHGAYDNFLPEDLALELGRSFPELDDNDWVVRDNVHNRRVFQQDETKLPLLHRQMLRELNSRQFILFIETLTGIDNLLPDPYFLGGGAHLSGRGDFLEIHADFNWHHKLQAHRRVNALLYLSEDWQEEWGGALEFWDREMTRAVDQALPLFNRLVVFSTSEHSNHGQRVPNECPPGVTRKVLNLYYYTSEREDEDADAAPHFTVYKTEASPFSVQIGADYRASGGSTAAGPVSTEVRPLSSSHPVVRPRPGNIPVAGPWITEREVEAVASAVRHSWYEGATTESVAFEAEFAEAVGRQHAIALPSCTSGLHLALLALGIGPGDEVIVPEATWIASAAPIHHVGATPIFVDVEPDTWGVSIESVRSALTPRTKALVLVDLYGGFPDLVALEALAAEHGIEIIEDAAQAAGGWHAGRAAGSFGRISTFSFHGTKTLTTGEGGMVLCDDGDLDQRMRFLRDQGRLPGDTSFRCVEIAWKYKMSELQAALGRVQLDRIEELVARKRDIFGWYKGRLDDMPLTLNVERPTDRSTFWMVTAVFDGATGLTSSNVRDELASHGMVTRPFFPPLSSLPAFAAAEDAARASAANQVSADLALRGINLPSALMLSEADVDRVCDVVRHLVATA